MVTGVVEVKGYREKHYLIDAFNFARSVPEAASIKNRPGVCVSLAVLSEELGTFLRSVAEISSGNYF